MGRVTLVVDPPDANVTIDGEPVDAESQGEIVVERPIGDSFTVNASRPPERREGEMKFESPSGKTSAARSSCDSPPSTSPTRPSGCFEGQLSDDARRGTGRGDQGLAPDKYARLPAPIERLAGLDPASCDCNLPTTAEHLVIASRDGTIRRLEIEQDGTAQSSAPNRARQRRRDSVLGRDRRVDRVDRRRRSRHRADTGCAAKRIRADSPRRVGRCQEHRDRRQRPHSGGRVRAASSLSPPVRRAWTLHAWKLDAANVAQSRQTLAQMNEEMEPLSGRGAWQALGCRRLDQ